MNLYVVSYDLVSPGKNYESLFSELVRLGGSRVLLSQWLVRSAFTSVQLRDHLRRFMDDNDRILVNVMDQNWAGYNLLTNPNNFGT